MYTQFFGLSEHPFSISPNPKYLYMSERHGEALAHLNYGLQDGPAEDDDAINTLSEEAS